VVDHALLALLVMALAGITDVVDGWWARRFGQVTPIGMVIDPITDKIFVASVVTTLVFANRLPPIAALLVATREIGEFPLVVWLAAHRVRHPRAAGYLGKMTTASQIATLTSAITLSRWTMPLTLLTAVLGVAAAVRYWERELRPWESAAGAP
jgi:CDP-diacylglycerol--glycerol-3-phosphate 3-phosphatidyltransferase/cardiolipin synthase